MNGPEIPQGYMDVFRYRKDGLDLADHEQHLTPHQAALAFAALFEDAVVVEGQTEWIGCLRIPTGEELADVELPPEVENWLKTPFEVHLARWKVMAQQAHRKDDESV